MTSILVPARATTEQWYEVVQCCQQIEGVADAVTLDASRTTRFGPFGVALLSMSLALRRLAGRPDLRLILPNDGEAEYFLREVGFPRFCVPSPAAGLARGTLEIRQLLALDPLYTEDVAELVASRVPGTSEDVAYLVHLCLNELLQNAFEHSQSRVGAFVHCRWYLNSRSVRLVVADAGIGIPAALRRQVSALRRYDDSSLVELAVTEEGVTSRQDRPGGLGLKHLHSVATERGGCVTVVSQLAKVSFMSKGRVQRRKAPYFRGTVIEIDFQPREATEALDKPVL